MGLIALVRTKHPVIKMFIHRSVIGVIGSLSHVRLLYRSLVPPPRRFSGMNTHRGLLGVEIPSMALPPYRPLQRLQVVRGGVFPPSAFGDENTVTGGADRKGNQILSAGITESLRSNPETHPTSGLSRFRSQKPPFIVSISLNWVFCYL